MAIYPPRPAPFTCAICQKARPLQWQDPTRTDYPPVCITCEQSAWRSGPYNIKPDIRLGKQIVALAEAIVAEATHQTYGGHYGRA